MNNMANGYSTISSAWFMLVFGDGNVKQRLTNALERVITLKVDELKPQQLHLFQRLGCDRLCELDQKQLLELVESLEEAKIHQLTDTIARLYVLTVRPDEA